MLYYVTYDVWYVCSHSSLITYIVTDDVENVENELD